MPYQTQHRGFEARAPYNTVEPVKEEEELIGSQFLDKLGQDIQEGIASATADQEGIGDDIVRLGLGGLKNIGHVANLPGIKQGLQIAGAPAWALGQTLGAGLEHGLGIDPRYGQIVGEVGGDLLLGTGAAKLGKVTRAAKALRKLPGQTSGQILKAGPGGVRTYQPGGVVQELLTSFQAGGKKQQQLIESLKVHEADIARKLSLTKPDTELWHSTASTPPVHIRAKGSPWAFKRKGHVKKGFEQHHKVQKRVSSRVLQRMRQLVADPSNPADDLHLLIAHELPNQFNLEAGSGGGALQSLYKTPHKVHHGAAKRGDISDGMWAPGLEPSGNRLEALYKEIDEIEDPIELLAIYEDFIETSSVPLTKESALYDEAFRKHWKSDKTELTKLKDKLKSQKKAIAEARLEAKQRKF